MNIVLVVDDTWELRELFMETLSDAGYEVHGAANGLEALNALDSLEGKPCVVLLDMMMPVMDGRAVCDALRANGGLPPVVVMTAADHVAQCARDVGAVGWLAKPFEIDELVAAIKGVLDDMKGEAAKLTPA